MKPFYKIILQTALCFCAATQGLYSQTPGGVTGANLWLKADVIPGAVDGAAVSSWSNTASGSAVLAPTSAGTGALAPVFKSGYVSPAGKKIGNFNPSVFFGGANSLAFSNLASGVNYSAFLVAETDDITNSCFLLGSTNPGGTCNALYFGGNSATLFINWGGGIAISSAANTIKQDVNHLVGFINGGTTSPSSITIDGLVGASTPNIGANASLCGNTFLGETPTYGNVFHKGTIQEVILYPNTATLSSTNALKINSYLALKYGITLNQTSPTNYMASNGTTAMWTASLAATGFTNNIFGIGKDVGSGLDQKVSASVNTSNIITLATTNNFTLSNQDAGRTSLSDLNFEVISNNSGAATWTGTGAITNYSVLSRAWQVQETGTIGNVFIQFDVANATFDVPNLIAGTNYYILTDPNGDGNYADGIATALTNTSGNLWSTSIDFTNGSKFTLATLAVIAPGGVAGANLWLKADAGTSSTIDGTGISAWNDQSGSANHVLQGTPANQPLYRNNSTDNMNFNPVMKFNGSSAFMDANTFSINGTTNTLFSAIKPAAVGGTWYDVLSFGAVGSSTGGELRLNSSSQLEYLQTAPGSFITSTVTVSANNTMLFGSTVLNNAANGANLFLNHKTVTIGSITTAPVSASVVCIGARTVGSRAFPFYGNIPEVITYNTALTATQRLQVNTYLALKYGTTLDQSPATNYLNTVGATVWDATTNATYKNNIAGIAREDNEALYQKQSMSSTNSSQQVLIGAGGALAASNAANTNTLTDGQYLVWGDDGGSHALATTISGITGVNYMMGATWKVQNTGSVGTVRVAWPVGITNLKLIQSTDAVFTAADVVTDMSVNTQTVNGTAYNYTDVTLSNGQFFTFAGFSIPPGGVAGFNAWFKGNNAANTPTVWVNETGSNNTTAGATPPVYNTSGSDLLNFNASYSFNTSSYMDFPAALAVGGSANSGYSFMGIAKMKGTANDRVFGAVVANQLFGYWAGTENALFMSNNPGYLTIGSNGVVAPTTNLNLFTLLRTPTTTAVSQRKNGIQVNSATVSDNTAWQVRLNAAFNLSGKSDVIIGEFISYPTDRTTDISRIESYLAIKYGITLNQSPATNYVNTTGATVWDATTNAIYKNNIAGIARDDNEALYQKQSMSSTVGTQQVLIGAGGTMAGSNAANTNTLTEGQYLVWGDDGGSHGLATAIAGITGVNYTMGATWKVQNTGSVGTVRVAWPVSIPNLKLIQSSDAVFTAGDVVTDMSANTQTVNGTPYNYADVTLSNGQFFTFAGFATAPGGVMTNLELWLKADNGAVTSGSNFTSWLDRSKNGFVFNGSATFPQFSSSSLNYNPGFKEIGTEAAFTKTETNYANWSLFTALKPGVTGNSANIISGAAFGVNYETWMNTNSLGVVVLGSGGLPSPLDYASSIVKVDTKPAMLSFIHSNLSNNVDIAYNYAGTKAVASLNTLNTNRPIGLKYIGYPYVGDLNDLIVYSTASMTASEKLRVESYLGLKYSITLDPASGSYLNSSAAPVYSIDATYKNQVIGIIRDDASGLTQKQSQVSDDSTRMYVSTLAATNLANAGSFSSDLQSVVMGTDGKLLRSAPSTTAELPTGVGITSRIEREWKITNTSFNGTFSLDVKLNTSPITASDLRILIDDDGNFTNATMYNPTISYAGGVVTISGLSTTHIPLNATKYLTIVSLSTSTPLPIGLLAFHATAMENTWVKLDWKTETELNNHYFTIEKSVDGIGWEEVTRVEGAGTSTTLRTYLAADSSPYEGMSYYRLKQTDFNYKYSYSAIKSVTIDKDGKGVRMYPNPFLNVITIEGPASEIAAIKVYTLLGKEVTGVIKAISKEATQVVLDCSKLNSGIYLIKTSTTSQKIYKE